MNIIVLNTIYFVLKDGKNKVIEFQKKKRKM